MADGGDTLDGTTHVSAAVVLPFTYPIILLRSLCFHLSFGACIHYPYPNQRLGRWYQWQSGR